MSTKASLQITHGGARVVLSKGSASAKRARLTSLRVMVYPPAKDPSLLPDGNIELSFEQQTQFAASDRVHVANADVMLTAPEFVEWLLAAADAAAISREDRVRLVERLLTEPDPPLRSATV